MFLTAEPSLQLQRGKVTRRTQVGDSWISLGRGNSSPSGLEADGDGNLRDRIWAWVEEKLREAFQGQV